MQDFSTHFGLRRCLHLYFQHIAELIFFAQSFCGKFQIVCGFWNSANPAFRMYVFVVTGVLNLFCPSLLLFLSFFFWGGGGGRILYHFFREQVMSEQVESGDDCEVINNIDVNMNSEGRYFGHQERGHRRRRRKRDEF